MSYVFFKKLRKDPRYQEVPFLMVTMDEGRESVDIAVAAGVEQFLIKPFIPATFRSKVNQMLQLGKNARHVTLQYDEKPAVKENKTCLTRGKKKTVLVIDDVPVNIDVITGILCDEYRVLAATNGKKALELAKGDLAVDLILLDIIMPEMDGMEVCRILKDDPVTVDIPIIFLTAKTEVDDIAAALDAGAVDYVTKPFHSKVLKARVRRQVSHKIARDALREHNDSSLVNAHHQESVGQKNNIKKKKQFNAYSRFCL